MRIFYRGVAGLFAFALVAVAGSPALAAMSIGILVWTVLSLAYVLKEPS